MEGDKFKLLFVEVLLQYDLRFGDRSYFLDVDSKAPFSCNSYDGNMAAVGQVEAQGSP